MRRSCPGVSQDPGAQSIQVLVVQYSVKLAVRALAHLIRFPVTNIREELVC
jgi:hypothetical protein